MQLTAALTARSVEPTLVSVHPQHALWREEVAGPVLSINTAMGPTRRNLDTTRWDVHHPFGGFREPGSPVKEQGASGLRFCTRLKTAAVRYAW